MNLPRLNNLTDLANLLRGLDNGPDAELGFDMKCTFKYRKLTKHECGSACCVDGWVEACNGPRKRGWSIISLGVSEDDANEICFPGAIISGLAYDATPQQAARVIEILRDEGVVDWPRAMAEVPA